MIHKLSHVFDEHFDPEVAARWPKQLQNLGKPDKPIDAARLKIDFIKAALDGAGIKSPAAAGRKSTSQARLARLVREAERTCKRKRP